MVSEFVIVSYIQFPSNVGLSYRIHGLTKALSHHGKKCIVLCPSDKKKQSPSNIGSVRIQNINIPHSLISRDRHKINRILGLVLFWIKSLPHILSHIIHNRTIFFEQALSLPQIMLFRVLSRKKAIVDDMILLHAYDKGRLSWLSYFMDIAVIRNTKKIVTASPLTLEFLRRNFPDKEVVFLPNGCEIIDPKLASSTIDASKPIRAVLVGSLSFEQNRIAVINTLRISEKLEDYVGFLKIDIVGGPQTEIQKICDAFGKLPPMIKFWGPVSSKRLGEIYASARIGLLPFFRNTPLLGGSRTKALECLAHGHLVISGPEGIGGLPGILRNSHYLEADDIAMFVDILEKVLANPQDYDSTRLNAYKYTISKFAWNELVKSLLSSLSSS